MRITVGVPKGGAGKTTTTGHLAMWLSLSGRTLVVDCDTEQSEMLDWANRADDWPVKRCTVIAEASRNLQRNVEPLLDDYDHVIFDVGAKNKLLLLQAMKMSDFLIAPSKATDGDLLELHKVFDVAAEVDVMHPIRPIVLLTMIRGGTNEERDARAYLDEMGLPAFRTAIPVLRQYGQMRYAPATDAGEYGDVLAELMEMQKEVNA